MRCLNRWIALKEATRTMISQIESGAIDHTTNLYQDAGLSTPSGGRICLDFITLVPVVVWDTIAARK